MKLILLQLLVFALVNSSGANFDKQSIPRFHGNEQDTDPAEEPMESNENVHVTRLADISGGDCSGDFQEKPLSASATGACQREVDHQNRYSSARAIELLANSWNDLSSWPPRNASSAVCERDVETAIRGYHANERWALHLFDAWSKPGPSLLLGRYHFVGSYTQCRGVSVTPRGRTSGFRGNYCVVTLINMSYTRPSGYAHSRGFKTVNLGTCMPNTCSPNDVTRLFQERIEMLKFGSLILASGVDCRTDDREYMTATKLAIVIILIIGSLCVLGTAVEVSDVMGPNLISSKQNGPEDNNGVDGSVKMADSSSAVPSLPEVPSSCAKKLLLSFSVWTNGRRFLSSSQESVAVIPGIRFLTMTWILIGHTCYLMIAFYADNSDEGLSSLVSYTFVAFYFGMQFGPDTFFAISGFLVSNQWVKPVMEQGWRFNWKYFYLHRYWRLTPPYMLAMLLVQGLQGLLVSGAVAQSAQPNYKILCQENWMYHLLYLNNLQYRSIENECFVHSWSLANDMQFYLLSPLMLIPFHYHKYAGIASCLLFILAQWTFVGSVSYLSGWMINMTSIPMEWFRYCYWPFYSRIGPFALGVLAGYVFTANDGRVQMKPRQIVIGWFLAVTVGLLILFGGHDYISGQKQASALVSAVIFASSRTVWSACVLWIIVACSSGYGGPVNAMLSWTPLVVLGRATYFAYLIQLSVITIVFENLERSVYLNVTSVISFGLSNLVLTCGLSAVLTVCAEYPMLNLERYFFGRKKH